MLSEAFWVFADWAVRNRIEIIGILTLFSIAWSSAKTAESARTLAKQFEWHVRPELEMSLEGQYWTVEGLFDELQIISRKNSAIIGWASLNVVCEHGRHGSSVDLKPWMDHTLIAEKPLRVPVSAKFPCPEHHTRGVVLSGWVAFTDALNVRRYRCRVEPSGRIRLDRFSEMPIRHRIMFSLFLRWNLARLRWRKLQKTQFPSPPNLN